MLPTENIEEPFFMVDSPVFRKEAKSRSEHFSSSSLTVRVVECSHADGDLSGQF
jgi:hypothetical protein